MNKTSISLDELEKWIKEEYFSLSGKVLTDKYMDFAVIEQFDHGGMSSGGVDNQWWMEEGIPLKRQTGVSLIYHLCLYFLRRQRRADNVC